MTNLVSFTPLWRQTVGFDRFNDLFQTLMNETDRGFDAYPPYNIEKLGEDEYRITMAVAGFKESDLNITAQDDALIVTGRMADRAEHAGGQYLHRGIAARAFEKTFRLADYIKVTEAEMKDGLLVINLVHEVPEEKKPRMIPIAASAESKKKH